MSGLLTTRIGTETADLPGLEPQGSCDICAIFRSWQHCHATKIFAEIQKPLRVG